MNRAYEEIVNFIAAGTTSDEVAHFTASQEVKDRVAYLIQREKMGQITPNETSELDHFMKLEHLMRLAKARAQTYAHQ